MNNYYCQRIMTQDTEVNFVKNRNYNKPQKDKTMMLLGLTAAVLFTIAIGFVLYYLISQRNLDIATDNLANQDNSIYADLNTIAPYPQSDIALIDVTSLNTKSYQDKTLGIQLFVPAFMSFTRADDTFTFNYSGKYIMPNTEGDQDSLSITIYRDLKLAPNEQSQAIPFGEQWTPTTELKAFGDRELQAFNYFGPSELNCKLYLFNANNGKVGGLCFNASRRYVDPLDGGITGDSSELAAADLATYNTILEAVMGSVKFTTSYQDFTDSISGISMQIPTKFNFQQSKEGQLKGYSGFALGKYAAPGTGGESDFMSISLFPQFDPENQEYYIQYKYTGNKFNVDGREIKVFDTSSIQLESTDCSTLGFTGKDNGYWRLTLCSSRHLYDNYFSGWDFKELVAGEKMEYSKIMSDIKDSIRFK